MKKNETLKEALRSKLVKNGSRGTTLPTIIGWAKDMKSTYNTSHVMSALKTIDVEKVDRNKFAICR